MPYDKNLELAYLKSLRKEWEEYQKEYDLNHIKTLYIGGGTPSINPETIFNIHKIITSSNTLNSMTEFTVECNPATINVELLEIFKTIGVTRISFGVQAFNDITLEYCGRERQANGVVEKALTFLADYDFTLNIDLIAGLPTIDVQYELTSLKRILQKNRAISHVSLYELSIEEGSAFFCNRPLILPDEEPVAEYEDGVRDILAEFGFERYEVSNYAKKGYRSQHNCMYWNYMNYLGLGPSAHSTVNGVRIENSPDLDLYNTGKSYKKKIFLTRKEQIEEYLLMGLRLYEGICLSDFENRFRFSFDYLFHNAFEKLAADSFISMSGDKKNSNCMVMVTDRGMNYLNHILVTLFDELDAREL